LSRRVSAIETKDDLATLVNELLQEFLRHPDEWQNLILDYCLESLSAWLAEMADDYLHLSGEQMPERPSWRALGEMLLAAKNYD
jgi:hypothetical protein